MNRFVLLSCVACLTVLTSSARAEHTRPRVAVAVHASGEVRKDLETTLSDPGALPIEVRLVALPRALSEEPAGDALLERIATARSRYVEADFEGCLAALPDETALVRALEGGGLTVVARTLVFRAACESSRGANAEARRAAERFAAWGLELPADVGTVTPDVERLLTDALRTTRAKPRVAFVVDSAPQGIEVLVDGAPRGCVTPCTLELVRGEHVVSVRGDGVTPKGELVRVTNQGERVALVTTPATPELAARQWSARYGGGQNVESTESLLLLAQAVRAPRLALLSAPGAEGALEVRGAYAVQGAVVARSGAENISVDDVDRAGVSVLQDLLIRGKTIEPAPPIWKSVWFWTAVTAVAATAVTVTAIVLHEPKQKAELKFDVQ